MCWPVHYLHSPLGAVCLVTPSVHTLCLEQAPLQGDFGVESSWRGKFTKYGVNYELNIKVCFQKPLCWVLQSVSLNPLISMRMVSTVPQSWLWLHSGDTTHEVGTSTPDALATSLLRCLALPASMPCVICCTGACSAHRKRSPGLPAPRAPEGTQVRG